MKQSKYALAKQAIELTRAGAEEAGIEAEDALLALLISSISEYSKVSGTAAARDALTYELQQLGGEVDTVFLRSR